MVGDAQQSIYGFRHADVELFEERGQRLEAIGARASLQTNFRSRAEILSALNGAFAAALGEGFRPLRAGRERRAGARAAGRADDRRQGCGAAASPTAGRAAGRALARGRGAGARRARARADRRRRGARRRRRRADARDHRHARLRAGARGRGRADLRDRRPRLLGAPAGDRARRLPARAGQPARHRGPLRRVVSPLCGLSLDGLVLVAAGARGRAGRGDRRSAAGLRHVVRARATGRGVARTRAAARPRPGPQRLRARRSPRCPTRGGGSPTSAS